MGKCKEITVNGIIVLLFLIIFGLAVFVTGFGAHVILQIEDIQIFLEDSFYNTVISGTGIGAAVLICIVILIISFAMIIALDDRWDQGYLQEAELFYLVTWLLHLLSYADKELTKINCLKLLYWLSNTSKQWDLFYFQMQTKKKLSYKMTSIICLPFIYPWVRGQGV